MPAKPSLHAAQLKATLLAALAGEPQRLVCQDAGEARRVRWQILHAAKRLPNGRELRTTVDGSAVAVRRIAPPPVIVEPI